MLGPCRELSLIGIIRTELMYRRHFLNGGNKQAGYALTFPWNGSLSGKS
jgi:hypothetical protein